VQDEKERTPGIRLSDPSLGLTNIDLETVLKAATRSFERGRHAISLFPSYSHPPSLHLYRDNDPTLN
jgi:hypothetical protein